MSQHVGGARLGFGGARLGFGGSRLGFGGSRLGFEQGRPRLARARLGIGLITIVSLAVVGSPQVAEAQLSFGLTVGPQSEQSAELAAPTGLATSTPSCASSTYHTAVPLSWAGSSALDEDGNYLVGYYGVWRSVNAGAYSLAGSTSGAPPTTTFTDDTATDALPTTTYYFTSGNTLGANYAGATTPIGTYDFGAEENLIASTTTPSGSWTYVAESGTSSHNVLVVDSLRGDANYDKVVSTVTLAGSAADPIAVTMAPNGSAAYVLDETNDEVDVIPVPPPTPAYTVTTTVPVGALGDPDAMAVTPNSSELLVANYAAGSVTVINTATDSVTATVPLPAPAGGQPPAPMGMVVLPSSADAYVVDQANNQLDELSLSGATANAFVAELEVGNQGTGAESPADIDLVQNPTVGTEIYVGDSGTDQVSVVAATSNTVNNVSIGAGNMPVALVAAPDGCFVAVAQGAGTVYLISATTNTVLRALTGMPATCLAMQGDSSAYVESSGSVAAVPTLLSYELQAVQTTTGSGFKSALSLPVNVSLGTGQVP
jgi:YVTN family beta-propeller protein